jgi:hypothetical protein
MMAGKSQHDERHSFLLRWMLRLGKPFGAKFVPDLTVQVIYRMGQYAGVRGPGQFRYDHLAETLGPQIFIGGQRRDFTFDGMLSQDAVPMTVRLNVLYSYNPRRAPDVAPALVRLPPETHIYLLGIFVEWATRSAVNQRNSFELARAPVLNLVESEIAASLRADIQPLGFEAPGARPVRVLQVQPPSSLTERQEQIAQRRAGILAGEEFTANAYRRALITEFIEQLARTGAGESIVNFNDLLDSYVAEKKAGAPPVIDPSMPAAIPSRPPNNTTIDDDQNRW